MLSIKYEEIFSLATAITRPPLKRDGEGTHIATVRRWATHGLRGHRLETIKIGGIVCTSDGALQRFFNKLGERDSHQQKPSTPKAPPSPEISRINRDGVPYGIEDVETGEIAAYITVSGDVGPEAEYLVGDDVLSLPRFVVGIRDLPFVELLIENKAQVQVRLRVVYAPEIPTYNVVGTLPGRHRDEILFIGHADSLILTEGANDNTATAIILLMLAHVFSGTELDYTLTFLISGSEEYGYAGARHYVRRRVAEGTHKNLKFIVNSDSLTYGPNLWASTDDAELTSVVKAIHADLDTKTEPIYREEPCWMNDASCFRGINPHVRGINFNSRGYDTLAANHTPDDDADQVPRDCAESSFLVLRELINRLQDL